MRENEKVSEMIIFVHLGHLAHKIHGKYLLTMNKWNSQQNFWEL